MAERTGVGMTLSRSTPIPSHDFPDQGQVRTCGDCGAVWNTGEYEDPPPWPCKREPLERTSGPKPVSDRRDAKRPDLGTDLQEYVEGLPCLLSGHPEHVCKGDVVAHHVVHKNHAGDWLERGGERVGNLVPMCSLGAHQSGPESVHVMGKDSFQERWDCDLAGEAVRLGERWRGRG